MVCYCFYGVLDGNLIIGIYWGLNTCLTEPWNLIFPHGGLFGMFFENQFIKKLLIGMEVLKREKTIGKKKRKKGNKKEYRHISSWILIVSWLKILVFCFYYFNCNMPFCSTYFLIAASIKKRFLTIAIHIIFITFLNFI